MNHVSNYLRAVLVHYSSTNKKEDSNCRRKLRKNFCAYGPLEMEAVVLLFRASSTRS